MTSRRIDALQMNYKGERAFSPDKKNPFAQPKPYLSEIAHAKGKPANESTRHLVGQ